MIYVHFRKYKFTSLQAKALMTSSAKIIFKKQPKSQVYIDHSSIKYIY